VSVVLDAMPVTRRGHGRVTEEDQRDEPILMQFRHARREVDWIVAARLVEVVHVGADEG
jgi:hypothetical protein